MKDKLFNGFELLYYIIGTGAVLFGLVAYAFEKFELKDDAKEVKSDLTQRLDRIESKIDNLLESNK